MSDLTREEIDTLARYCNERDHGLSHTDAYKERMSELRMRYLGQCGRDGGIYCGRNGVYVTDCPEFDKFIQAKQNHENSTEGRIRNRS